MTKSTTDKPHVGARVSTNRRVIAGVPRSDTGTITRLEDGGYCVVKWDSDGEELSALMMSLRPLTEPATSTPILDDDAVGELCVERVWDNGPSDAS